MQSCLLKFFSAESGSYKIQVCKCGPQHLNEFDTPDLLLHEINFGQRTLLVVTEYLSTDLYVFFLLFDSRSKYTTRNLSVKFLFFKDVLVLCHLNWWPWVRFLFVAILIVNKLRVIRCIDLFTIYLTNYLTS